MILVKTGGRWLAFGDDAKAVASAGGVTPGVRLDSSSGEPVAEVSDLQQPAVARALVRAGYRVALAEATS